jgi:hypothetical protein
MKHILFISLTLISFSSCFGQKDSLKIDSQYFLLGTLSDYLGRRVYMVQNEVDGYGFYESKLVNTIDSLFQKDKLSLKIVKYESTFKIMSEKLTKKIDKFYDYVPNDKLVANEQPTLFTGKLKPNIFSNDIQKISFVVGAYTRFGEKNDTTLCIRIYNSLSKAKTLVNVLKELGCAKVSEKIMAGDIPSHFVYFNPIVTLKKHLNIFLPLKIQLHTDTISWAFDYLENLYENQPDKLREEKEKWMKEFEKIQILSNKIH